MRNIQIKLGTNSVYGVFILCNAAAFGRTAVINRRSTSSHRYVLSCLLLYMLHRRQGVPCQVLVLPLG